MATEREAEREKASEVILLGFRIERGFVFLINREGENVPLFPAKRLDEHDLNNSLRHAVTVLLRQYW